MNTATTTSVNTVNGDTGIKVVGTAGSYPGIVKTSKLQFRRSCTSPSSFGYILMMGILVFELPTQIIDIGIDLLLV